MRKIARLFKVFTILISVSVFAQPKQYVTWTFSQNKLGNDEVELVFTAKIEKGWHLYSQIGAPDTIVKKDGSMLKVRVLEDNRDNVTYNKTDDPNGPIYTISKQNVTSVAYAEGPLPTVFKFEKSGNFKLVEKTTEPRPTEKAEPVFENMVLRFFADKAVFRQKIKVLSSKPFSITGYIDGMACNETQCQKFSPSVDFEFKIEGGSGVIPVPVSNDTVGKSKDTLAVQPAVGDSGTTEVKAEPAKVNPPEKKEGKSWLGIFIAGFIGGFAALLTPCVFPMIPMTVSFFTKQSKTKASGIRNAFLYSISIIAIYVTLGLGITLIFGADALNKMSTSFWFNIIFFLIIVLFAFSFLGAFEITLPSAFVNKMDSQSARGGLIGIFFMAFTLSLVSFSCTGPIVGTLLFQAADTGAIAGPFFGMLGFSMALALPFGLFAAFPGWMNSLPKSGGWLNSVKVVLGFLELALALKFASNADLKIQAGVLTREVFIVIWIVIFALLGGYLMGWFKLAHDSDLKYVSVPRLMIAIFAFSFTIYLIPGLWGAPLKLISGFPPPDFYTEAPDGFGGRKQEQVAGNVNNDDLPGHAHRGPNGIPAFDDYYHAREFAKKMNKPVLVDFTGWNCVNCRKMESKVWSDPEVKRKLSEEFVLASLYVDDGKTLIDSLQKEVSWNGKMRKLKSIGDRWAHLQNTKYEDSTQPQYWIIDGDEKRYSDSASYNPDIQKYIDWLNKGLARYNKEHKK